LIDELDQLNPIDYKFEVEVWLEVFKNVSSFSQGNYVPKTKTKNNYTNLQKKKTTNQLQGHL